MIGLILEIKSLFQPYLGQLSFKINHTGLVDLIFLLHGITDINEQMKIRKMASPKYKQNFRKNSESNQVISKLINFLQFKTDKFSKFESYIHKNIDNKEVKLFN